MSGVELALSNATGEVTLVVFTTLAPTAVFAYLLVLAAWARRAADAGQRRALRKQLWVPLVLAMLGLVASATHLGNPANALYVFAGIGQSPLSNEVLAAVVFLALAAVFWLSGFCLAEHPRPDRLLAALVAAGGIAFVAAMSLAYAVETIPTWDQPLVPAAIAVSGLAGGPILALLVLRLAGIETARHAYEKLLAAVGAAASCAWVVLHIGYGLRLSRLGNALFSADELAPVFWPLLAVSALLLAVSCALAGLSLRPQAGAPAVLRLRATGTLLALVAVFAMRFTFYMLHLTIGVAV